MKRAAWVFTCLALCLVLFASCTQYAAFEQESAFLKVQEDGAVQMRVQTLDLENKTVELVIQNNSAEEASFDKVCALERKQDGVWYTMQDQRSIDAIGILLPAGEETAYTYSWEQPLPKGEYRLVKSFYLPQGQINAGVYFTVE